MNRPVLLSLAAFFVVTASVVGFFLARPNPMAIRVQQLEAELTQAKAENVRLKSDVEKLKKAPVPVAASASSLAQRETRVMGLANPLTKPLDPKSTNPVADEASTGSTSSRSTVSSSVRAMMSRISESRIELTFGKLFKQLGLSETETEHFKRLINDRQTANNDLLLKMGERGLTSAQRKAVTDEIAAAKSESDKAIRQFLNNDDDYRQFQEWDETRTERYHLQKDVVNFDAADVPLSGAQRDQLLEVIIAVHKAQRQPPASSPPGSPPPIGLAARQQAEDQSVLQQAAAFLTPEQLAILEKTQKQRRSVFESILPPTKPKQGVPAK